MFGDLEQSGVVCLTRKTLAALLPYSTNNLGFPTLASGYGRRCVSDYITPFPPECCAIYYLPPLRDVSGSNVMDNTMPLLRHELRYLARYQPVYARVARS